MYKYVFPFILAVSFLSPKASAQLVVDTSATAQDLAQALVGPGVTISNVSQPINFSWPDDGPPFDVWRGSGTFSATGTNLGMSSGIILGSGPVSFAPWSPTPLSTQYIYTNGDDDLTVLIGGTPGSPYAITYDASILEFDFIPNGDSIKFRYVFASDEYPEYVCSQYNDVFGFFLSGPGINGIYSNNSMNIAVIPGTTIPVAINSVNSGEVGYAIAVGYDPATCAETDPNWENNSIYFVDNETGTDVSYDGFTVVLEAKAAVQCGETYHIKLAVADYVDRFLDATVFLEAGSFTSTGEPGGVSLVPGVGISGDTLTEGCPAEFLIQRNGDISTAATIDLVVGGTATSGVDLLPAFPAQLTFAPGEASQTILVDVPVDGDPVETIAITLTGVMTCAGAMDAEYTFYIDPALPLEVELADASLGCTDELVLEPVVTGGSGAYEYLWSTGETTPFITVQPAIDTEYEVTVSDGCSGTPVLATAVVSLDAEPIVLMVSEETAVPCGGEEEIEVASITGGTEPYSFEWIADGITVGEEQSILVTGGSPAWYVVTVTDGCGAMAVDSVLVTAADPPPIYAELTPVTTLLCEGSVEVAVLNVSGGSEPYQYEWLLDANVVGSTAAITVDEPGWYTVIVTESCGGSVTDSVLVDLPPTEELIVSTTDDVQIPCGAEAEIAVLSVDGGNGNYNYSWTVDGSEVATGISFSVAGGSPIWYVVTVEDGCGATGIDSVLVSAAPGEDLVVLTSPDVTVACVGDTVLLEVLQVEGATGALIHTWTNSAGQEIGTGGSIEMSIMQSGTFTVTVIDECGNIGSASMTATLDLSPLDLQLSEDLLICVGDTVELLAQVTGGSAYFIDWQGLDHSDPILNVAPSYTTAYTVTVTGQCGQSVTESITVQVENAQVEILVTNQGPDDWLLQSVSSPTAISWIWNLGNGVQYRDPQVAHSFVDLDDHWVQLQITTPNGCTAVDSVLLQPPAALYFPNAFTPDGDGFNDLFGADGHSITDFELEVFNRWGELIYRSQAPGDWWDGTYNGELVQTGVYVYKYTAEGLYFPRTEGFGHVTLLRGDLD